MSTFEFNPRPEAKPMPWNHLVPPVQCAVRDLLVNLAGAVRQSQQKDLEVASCFLVNGERGTGKTSVLLNARKAVEQPDQFFLNWEGKTVINFKKNGSGSDRLLISLKEDKEGSQPNGLKGSSEYGRRYVITLPPQELESSSPYSEVSYLEISNIEREANECAKTVKDHAVWLDVLDLEPLQSDANLLTTVLTRIREVLCQSNCNDNEQEITSLFEANPNSARPLLDQLLNDASLMWENIKEQDTRTIAFRQVAAAGIYAKFKKLFRQTMDKLTEELGRPYGKDCSRSIILPIDNIDRSIEHLNNIVKLTQLISHPHLWLVMAGGREDIDNFLTRVFWSELTRNSEVPWEDGKGEDQTMVMARRQAAATSQKIWPSSHRIVISLMQPEQTLRFCPIDKENVGSIENLLRQVEIPTWLKNGGEALNIPLFDLFEHDCEPFDVSDVKNKAGLLSKIRRTDGIYKQIRDQLSSEEVNTIDDSKFPTNLQQYPKKLDTLVAKVINIFNNNTFEKHLADAKKWGWANALFKKKETTNGTFNYTKIKKALLHDAFAEELIRPFTMATKNGLKLPARNVLELWQIAHWVVNDKTYFSNTQRPKAEQIARTMLRNLIGESNLSSHLSRHLQENIIRNDVNGGTLLNFRDISLNVECIAPNDTEIKFDSPPSGSYKENNIQSSIRIKRGNESFLRFKLMEKSTGEDGHIVNGELPDFVAAWLTVLYDVLVFAERLAVLSAATIPPPKIATSHAFALKTMDRGWHQVKEEFMWPIPKWSSFMAHSLFWRHWKIFQRNLDDDLKRNQDDYPGEFLSEYMAIGWQNCVLKTHVELHRQFNSGASSENVKSSSTASDEMDVLDDMLMDFIDEKYNFKLRMDPSGNTDFKNFLLNHKYAVLWKASVIHDCLTGCVKNSHRLRKRFNSQKMLEWLEKDLPMMFSYWYIPTEELKLNIDTIKIDVPKILKDVFLEFIGNIRNNNEFLNLKANLEGLENVGKRVVEAKQKVSVGLATLKRWPSELKNPDYTQYEEYVEDIKAYLLSWMEYKDKLNIFKSALTKRIEESNDDIKTSECKIKIDNIVSGFKSKCENINQFSEKLTKITGDIDALVRWFDELKSRYTNSPTSIEVNDLKIKIDELENIEGSLSIEEFQQHIHFILTKYFKTPDERIEDLTKEWKKNIGLIVAAMDDQIADIFKPKDNESKVDEKFRKYIWQNFLEVLTDYCFLHKRLIRKNVISESYHKKTKANRHYWKLDKIPRHSCVLK